MTLSKRMIRSAMRFICALTLTTVACSTSPPMSQEPDATESQIGETTNPPEANEGQPSDERGDSPSESPDAPIDTTEILVRMVVQDFGSIDIMLMPAAAPQTVAAFLEMADEGFYDNTIVHRVVSGFVIQAGALDASGIPLPQRDRIESEADNGLSNMQGSISTALMADDPDSFRSSFFINIIDNAFLDFNAQTGFGHTVFGQVESGFEVVKAIEGIPVLGDAPFSPPVIISISRITPP